jgi:hypothetical protein
VTGPAKQSSLLTCFVSAASQTDSAPVVAALQLAGVQVQTTNDIPLGEDVSSALSSSVLAVDFVCVVVDSKALSPTVAFEAGVAAGSRRPIIVAVQGNLDGLDSGPLASLPRITYSDQDSTGLTNLNETMAAYVRNVQPIASQLQIRWSDWIGGDAFTRGVMNSVIRASGFERRVAERLQQAGAVVNTEVRNVDIVATFPMLGTKNIIAVEVKSRRLHRKVSQRQELESLYAAMLESGTILGLLVYSNDEVETRIDFDADSLFPAVFGGILVTSVRQLLEWSDDELMRELTQLRNFVIHGSR